MERSIFAVIAQLVRCLSYLLNFLADRTLDRNTSRYLRDADKSAKDLDRYLGYARVSLDIREVDIDYDSER